MKPPKISEADIQRTCTELLELDGWRALRTDPVSDRARGKGFGELGMADHLYIRYVTPPLKPRPENILAQSQTETIWIEWKRLKRENRGGGCAYTTKSKNQQNWHVRERARGALTLIAGENFPASIEGFVDWYNKSGLARRRLSMTHVDGARWNRAEPTVGAK